MAQEDHKADAPRRVGCFVLTMSDSRTLETETSGRAIAEMLEAAGHQVVARELVKDDPALVRTVVGKYLAHPDVRAVITTGGTGISRRDSSFEAIDAMLEKRLTGFGELFRMLSYADIGSAAIMSRACAGTIDRKIVFALPGAEGAVRLAMEKLILPELGHVVRELNR
jgi:molybdenum cofactor biosynthesis protein B